MLYITPDAIIDFTGISFEQIGERRVRVSGARHVGRPDRLKVSGFAEVPGAISDVEISYAGDGALSRAEIAADVLRLRLSELGVDNATVDLVGVNAVLGSVSRPLRADPPELRVHVVRGVRRPRPRAGRRGRGVRAHRVRPGGRGGDPLRTPLPAHSRSSTG